MTLDSESEDTTVYKAVMNHEEQYSIWPADKANPPGWNDAGKTGSKAECLAYIKDVWTDMRPLTVRKKLEEAERNQANASEPLPPASAQRPDPEESLVDRLSRGRHPVKASLRPDSSTAALKERIERGYVHLKFTATKGGTELGVRLNMGASDLSAVDFEKQTGTAHLVGRLTLDYVPVTCIADIDVQTLKGEGHLEVLPA